MTNEQTALGTVTKTSLKKSKKSAGSGKSKTVKFKNAESPKSKNITKANKKQKSNKKSKKVAVQEEVEVDDDETGEQEAEVKHLSLLKAIQSLDGKKASISQRNDSVLVNTVESHSRDTEEKRFGGLLKALDSSNDLTVKKNVRQQDGSEELPAPLEKVYVNKAERAVTYSETKSEVDKWQTIIEDNRVVPQQQFPLERSRITIPTARKEASTHQPRTAMELEIQALLRGPEFVAEQAELAARPVLTKTEERIQRAMDMAQAKEELALRRKHRRMVSDIASKNRRQGKIKSRAYHKHLKADRRKTAFKALEKLKADDPEIWKEKAEEIERARIEERATLRHKGRSQFSKLAKRYGKFNEKIKDSLDEMRAKGVELLTKQPEEESSEEEEESDEERADVDMGASDESDEEEGEPITAQQNPWMSGKLTKEKADRRPEPLIQDSSSEEEEEIDDSDESEDEAQRRQRIEALSAAGERDEDVDGLVEGQTTRRIQSRTEVDKFDAEFDGLAGEADPHMEDESDEEEIGNEVAADIDPNKVISIPSTDLSGQVRADGDSSEDEDDQHKLNIAQAFADDDVVEEFSAKRKRKFDEADAEADAAEALNKLPGWGRWAGAGIEENKPKRKMSRFEKERRRIESLRKAKVDSEREAVRSKYPKGVIVNEQAIRSQPIAKYQVQSKKTRLTAPTFSALMSHPIGRDFVPTVAHNELCKPRVVTSVGTIITPMSKDLIKESKKETFPRSTAEPTRKLARQYELEPLKRRQYNANKRVKKLIKS